MSSLCTICSIPPFSLHVLVLGGRADGGHGVVRVRHRVQHGSLQHRHYGSDGRGASRPCLRHHLPLRRRRVPLLWSIYRYRHAGFHDRHISHTQAKSPMYQGLNECHQFTSSSSKGVISLLPRPPFLSHLFLIHHTRPFLSTSFLLNSLAHSSPLFLPPPPTYALALSFNPHPTSPPSYSMHFSILLHLPYLFPFLFITSTHSSPSSLPRLLLSQVSLGT